MCCPAQLGGSLVSICLPRLHPAGVRFTLLLQALPFCCGLRTAAMGYALWWSLFVVVGCLGNGRLRQQWAFTSVGADCLGSGRRPSPMELRRTGFSCVHTWSVWNRRFVCPTALPETLSPWNLLGWLTVQVPFSLKFSPPKSQVAGPTGHPDECAFSGPLCSATTVRATAAPAAGCASQNLCLASHISSIPRNFPVLWATKIRLEMRP